MRARRAETEAGLDWNKLRSWLLLIGSLAIGLCAGLCGFWIFEAKVPAAMQTTMLATEARLYYLSAGLALGAVVHGWAGVVSWFAKRARPSRSS